MYWERFAAECEAAGMRISTSKSEGHGSRPEKGGVPSPGWVERSCLKWRSSRWLGTPLEIDRVRSSVTREVLWEELGAAPPSQIERGVSWGGLGICFGCLLDASLGRCSRHACPTGRRPRGRPRTRWRDYVSRLAWRTPQGPPGRARGSVWGEGSLGISAQTAASATRSRIKQ
ncbi:hypothetical protein L3Q82_023001, partial [Scortum barcoo]